MLPEPAKAGDHEASCTDFTRGFYGLRHLMLVQGHCPLRSVLFSHACPPSVPPVSEGARSGRMCRRDELVEIKGDAGEHVPEMDACQGRYEGDASVEDLLDDCEGPFTLGAGPEDAPIATLLSPIELAASDCALHGLVPDSLREFGSEVSLLSECCDVTPEFLVLFLKDELVEAHRGTPPGTPRGGGNLYLSPIH